MSAAEKVKIWFIVNPISGGKDKRRISGWIDKHLDTAKFEPSIFFTTEAGHATELTRQALQENVEVVTAVGGDGTINEIAGVLIGTSHTLAVVPYGSGNGLARFLKIPLKPINAIKQINNFRKLIIDTATLNGKHFINMAGTGLDARVSEVFAADKTRGLSAYIINSIKEFINYRSLTYQVVVDGHSRKVKAMAVSIANSSQYGNNLHIAPTASVTDGLLDVCIVKPLSIFTFPKFAFRLFFSKNGDESLVQVYKGKKIEIYLPQPGPVHLDGEPAGNSEALNIEVKPLSLSILVA